MATTGAAAEASSHSRRRTLDTSPRRPSGGGSFNSTIGNDGAGGVGPHGWIGMVGWLRIMAFSRTATAGRSQVFEPRSGTVEHSRPHWGGHRTVGRGYNRPTMQASPGPGDFRGRVASKKEHLEAGTCRRNEQLERTTVVLPSELGQAAWTGGSWPSAASPSHPTNSWPRRPGDPPGGVDPPARPAGRAFSLDVDRSGRVLIAAAYSWSGWPPTGCRLVPCPACAAGSAASGRHRSGGRAAGRHPPRAGRSCAAPARAVRPRGGLP